MFTIIKPDTNIQFVENRRYAFALSGALILLSLGVLVLRGGPRYGIDFAGGTLLHVRFAQPVGVTPLRAALATLEGDVSVQDFGAGEGEYLLRVPEISSDLSSVGREIQGRLDEAFGAGSYEVLRTEAVGPRVGRDLRRKGILAVLFATVMMGVYIAVRFELRFGIGAGVALAHDVMVTVGALVLLNYEFDLTIVAALLAIVGFSVNDTVIVSDRIRENMRKIRRQPLGVIINRSINETLSRSVLTAGTTVAVVVALYVLGGSVIHGFAFALLVGFSVGTYSSIFVASPIVLALEGAGRRPSRESG